MRRTARLKFLNGALTAILPLWFGPFLFSIAPAQTAEVPDDAWWNMLAVGQPLPAPTTVPEDSIAVGHTGLTADKMAAIGISLEADQGSVVQALSLTLKEADVPLANTGLEEPAVVACPITGPWDPVHNGDWEDVPTFDCDIGQVTGLRSEAGTWAFDLSSFGEMWLDAEFPLAQRGVLFLIEESSTPSQVSFLGVQTREFRLEFAVSSPDAPDDPEPAAEPEPVVVGELEVPADTPLPAPAAPQEAEPAVIVAQPAQSRAEVVSEPDILGNLPWATWILVPAVVALAIAVSYALRSDARPVERRVRREGAVSRALTRGSDEKSGSVKAE